MGEARPRFRKVEKLTAAEQYREDWRCTECGARESKMPGAVPRISDGTPGPATTYQKACSEKCRKRRTARVLSPRYTRKPSVRVPRRVTRAATIAGQLVDWLGPDFSKAYVGGRDEAVAQLGLALERYLEGNRRGLRRERGDPS